MNNPYREYLDFFFNTITDFKHKTNRINKVLTLDAQLYQTEGSHYYAGTSLIISDWSGPTDNGWAINFHTGTLKTTVKDNYLEEINKILSREFGYAFSQCFEALEKLLKDFISIKIETDIKFKNSLGQTKDYSRENLKGGDELFKLIKKACGENFNKTSNKTNNNFKLKQFFKIISETRHAIVHSQSFLKTGKIPKDKYYTNLFHFMFPMNKLENETIELIFNYQILDKLLIYIAEFGYQLYKLICQTESIDWKI